ncbi:MAG: hypothetical protein DRN00_03425, partial [Thermoplasmata archaeon]
MRDFVKKLADGERFFLEIDLPEGTDLTELVPLINEILEKGDPLTIDRGTFPGLKAEKINFSKLNYAWEPSYPLCFVKSNLKEANFSGANLKGADFSKSNLSFAKLKEADMEGADFQDSDLSSAYMKKSNLSNADFSNAFMERADLRESRAHLT